MGRGGGGGRVGGGIHHICGQPPSDLSIHTTALWASISPGTGPNSSGAAGSTTFAASRRKRQLQQTPTIARMGLRTGKQAGQSPRKNGVVGFMGKAARTKAAAAPRQLPSLNRTIAMLDLRIGWQAGQLPRSRGAARTRAKGALQRQEDAPNGKVKSSS